MPTTRRKRANPPEQPENNTPAVEPTEVTVETTPTEIVAPDAPPIVTEARSQVEPAELPLPVQAEHNSPESENPTTAPSYAQPMHAHAPIAPVNGERPTNGERSERQDHSGPQTHIEGGRRTARGELFRRPPQPPPVHQAPSAPATAPAPAPLQAPSHEITLPLGRHPGDSHGDPLHLAYNPGYTGSDEMRSALLHKLAQESKNGGRARCWNCGSIAIVYERWNTRSKTFGEIGVAICEICGVWSVM